MPQSKSPTALKKHFRPILVLALASAAAAAPSIAVSASIPAPAPVGSKVVFSATVDGANETFWYRFRVRSQNGEFRTLRDFGPVPSLTWTASDHEGTYEIEVSARGLSGDVASTIAPFEFTPRAFGSTPVVSPTTHPLVFLYSAAGCTPGQHMRVEFSAGGMTQQTPLQECDGRSMNFYLAGLRANATYAARHFIDTRGESGAASLPVSFTTGSLPTGLFEETILHPAPVGTSNNILLGSSMARPAIATDISGNVVWFGPPEIAYITRTAPFGYFWGLVGVPAAGPERQLIRMFDLTGMTVLETNAARVNEQLAALGKRPITAFHHEATPLPGGRVAVLGGVEQILSDVQGPGPIDIVGDMIVVLDRDLNVVWSWDTFDHLDIGRKAVLGETCPGTCPPMRLAQTGNDWTHGNSVQPTRDGSLIYSSRHQDWLIKIAYENASGDGRILWRMGKDGDFTVKSTDPFPWFSHQHDANFESTSATRRSSAATPLRMMVFDNGNTRIAAQGGNSRGQVFEVDEEHLTVTPILNVDLGVYSIAVGSAEKLADGNFHFDAGFIQEANGIAAHSFEVTSDSAIIYDARANTPLYRSFRLNDIYSSTGWSRLP